MKLYRTREGSCPDDDVKTQLSTAFSQSAPGPLLVPGTAKYLVGARVSFCTSNEAADGYAALFRLEGPGLKQGDFVGAMGAGGGAVATGGRVNVPAVEIPLNLEVTPGQEILIFAEPLGGDMGTAEAVVTLIFSDQLGEDGLAVGEITVEGEIGAIDTLTRFTTQGSVSAPSRLTPPNAKKIDRIIYAVAGDAAADGEASLALRLGGNAVRGGEQLIALGSDSFIDVQSGSDAAHATTPVQVMRDVDIEVVPSETLDLSMEMGGVDVGTVTGVVTVIFA